MITTTSSTADMVTQGKFQINGEDNVEGKSSERFVFEVFLCACDYILVFTSQF